MIERHWKQRRFFKPPLFSLSIRESNTIWFTQANFPQSCVKMLVNPSGLSALFPCLTKKFALWKLRDPAHRKIFVFLVRKGAARLTPCKTDNPKRRKFNICRAYGVRLSNAYTKKSSWNLKNSMTILFCGELYF